MLTKAPRMTTGIAPSATEVIRGFFLPVGLTTDPLAPMLLAVPLLSAWPLPTAPAPVPSGVPFEAFTASFTYKRLPCSLTALGFLALHASEFAALFCRLET